MRSNRTVGPVGPIQVKINWNETETRSKTLFLSPRCLPALCLHVNQKLISKTEPFGHQTAEMLKSTSFFRREIEKKLDPKLYPKEQSIVVVKHDMTWKGHDVSVELNTAQKLPTCFREGRFLWPQMMAFQMMIPRHRSFLKCGYTRKKKKNTSEEQTKSSQMIQVK